ncbi:MAG: 6-bladed beta-propeller [Gemmatimonadota bacterium]|nr:6-bladed beta-propeller [Gemmatimonadota bacterium]MDE2863862.1 6-bladed beta-propeller [Gemmatimonadota bacterium]
MTVKTLSTAALFLFPTALSADQSLLAQEVIDLTARDQRLDADFEEVFRLGVLEGEDWEMFGTVMHIGFDENGNLYIVDGSGGMSLADGTRVLGLGSAETRVLVFDATGDFLREFGASGEGPGEFNMAAGFAIMRDGTTIVSDFGHHAYQVFDANGDFLRMVWGSDVGGPGGMARDLLADPRGNAVFTGSFGRAVAMIGAAGPPTTRPITRLGLAGEEVQTDTVVEAWLPPRAKADLKLPGNFSIPEGDRATLANALSALSQPTIFEPSLLAGVLPNGGIVYSDSSAEARQ